MTEPSWEYAEIGRLLAEVELLKAALTGAETVMMIVEPRSQKAQYLAALAAIRAALEPKP